MGGDSEEQRDECHVRKMSAEHAVRAGVLPEPLADSKRKGRFPERFVLRPPTNDTANSDSASTLAHFTMRHYAFLRHRPSGEGSIYEILSHFSL